MYQGKKLSDGKIVKGSLLEASDGTFIVSNWIKVYNDPRLIEGDDYVDEVCSKSVRKIKFSEREIEDCMSYIRENGLDWKYL